MNKLEIIHPKSNSLEPNFRTPRLSKAKFLRIRTDNPSHYAPIMQAFGVAKEMPLDPIPNAALYLGHPVDELPEKNAIIEGLEETTEGLFRKGNSIILFRRKKNPQLDSPDYIEGIEVSPLIEEPTQLPSTQPQPIEKPASQTGAGEISSDLGNNPYLKAPANLKPAA